jgi:hypothetical protein
MPKAFPGPRLPVVKAAMMLLPSVAAPKPLSSLAVVKMSNSGTEALESPFGPPIMLGALSSLAHAISDAPAAAKNSRRTWLVRDMEFPA